MTEEISDVENEDRYNLLMDYMRNRKPLKFIEWWEVENTGWSGGVSWFRTGGTNGDPRRFETCQGKAIPKEMDKYFSIVGVVKNTCIHLNLQHYLDQILYDSNDCQLL